MFTLAILISVYSYLIFALGLLGLLYPGYILLVSVEFFLLCLLFLPTKKISVVLSLKSRLLLALLFVMIGVNALGALGPELGFDALWYHLTIPKIWLLNHKIFFLSDGRYYYSVMPKLAEMGYLSVLALSSEIGAKVMHLGWGLLTMAVVYRIARKWLSQEYSVLAMLVFYANLVVGWQSTTAYVDLCRAFFEALAFYCLVDNKIYKSGLALGLAIATKLLAVGTLPVFWVLLVLQKTSFKTVLVFTVFVAVPVLPWLLFAYLSTGNPIYPIFSGYDLSSVRHVSDVITIFARSADPLSPIYLMLLPLTIYFRNRLPKQVTVYCLLALMVWWFVPRTGGGRFILPYLPVFSVLAVLTIKLIKDNLLRRMAIGLVIVLMLISIGVRAVANSKFIPVVFGKQTKQQFLDKNLNKHFGGNYFYLDNPL